MNIEKSINKFVDNIYYQHWFGEELEEEYGLTKSKYIDLIYKSKDIDSKKVMKLILRFREIEELSMEMFYSISKVQQFIETDPFRWDCEQIDMFKLTIVKELVNIKEVSV